MKNRYKICLLVWLAEFIAVYFLDKSNVHFHSVFVHAIGTLLFFLPIIALFVLMSKDEDFPEKKRVWFKVIYAHIILCYAGGLVASFLLG